MTPELFCALIVTACVSGVLGFLWGCHVFVIEATRCAREPEPTPVKIGSGFYYVVPERAYGELSRAALRDRMRGESYPQP